MSFSSAKRSQVAIKVGRLENMHPEMLEIPVSYF